MATPQRRPWLALFEPNIPGNFGAALRLAACLDVELHVVEPCGFPLDDRRLKRAGLDYAAAAGLVRHADFAAFRTAAGREVRRLVLLSTKASTPYHRFAYRPGDVLLAGRESAGVPDAVAASCGAAVRIPLKSGLRSLNVVVAAGMALGQCMASQGLFPGDAERGDEEGDHLDE